MNKKEIKSFNIITLGDSGVGKTSIINRYIKNEFDENNEATLGIKYSYKEIKFNNKDKIILKLVDTAGQERFRSLTKSYFKNVDAVLFVFSMDDKDSFDTIKDWMELFKDNNSKEDITKYLVGNKDDLKIKVEQSLIDEFIKENNIPYMSTSAKENKNIDELFEEIGKKLYTDFQKNENKNQNRIKIKIIKIKKKRCCVIILKYNLIFIY